MSDSLQAFFFGTSFGEIVNGKPIGVSGFAIPDLGIIFRTRWVGTIHECQYAGLLALLKFIDTNKKELKGIDFEVLSDSALVIYQIANKKFISRDLLPFYNAAIDYKRKVSYKVSWVPREENVAITGLSDVPPLAPDINLRLDLGPSDTDVIGNSVQA
jgi:hypothetical protein